MIKKIAVTTGDIDGIGLEIVCKSFRQLKNFKDIDFLIYYKNKKQLSHLKKISQLSSNHLHFIHQDCSPAFWVIDSIQNQINKDIHGLVTGPLSKTEIQRSGLKDIGHTDIIKRMTKTKNAYMAFLGQKFNVALLTGHIPLSNVQKKIDQKELLNLITLVHKFNLSFQLHNFNKHIGILGLNPHAGDFGLIGKDEVLINKTIQKAKKSKIKLTGPLVPDSAFKEPNWGNHSFYIALYHDQGLIPFKMAHGHGGCHMTLGVPIIRTSVDHGPAFDIYGKNSARPESMIEAIQLCVDLVRRKNV